MLSCSIGGNMTNRADVRKEFEAEREERRKNSPTLYQTLEKELIEEGLSYDSIEAVTILDPKSQQPKILDKEQAREVFSNSKLINSHETDDPDNLPFYAYTKDRIFYMSVSDEMVRYWISSIPRNPTEEEDPEHLPC